MRINELAELTKLLKTAGHRFPGTSMLYTGSVARREVRVFAGRVASDIDLVLLVPNLAYAHEYRRSLLELVGKAACRFDVEVSCTLTLQNHFKTRQHAAYVCSARHMEPLWDDLGAGALLRKSGPVEEVVHDAALAQQVSYYTAKALHVGSVSDVDKAYRVIELLAEHLGALVILNEDRTVDDLEFTSRRLLSMMPELWNSSRYFLDSPGDISSGELLQGVRDRVFMENHGIDFKTAFVKGVNDEDPCAWPDGHGF